jgi:hypothetical protein
MATRPRPKLQPLFPIFVLAGAGMMATAPHWDGPWVVAGVGALFASLGVPSCWRFARNWRLAATGQELRARVISWTLSSFRMNGARGVILLCKELDGLDREFRSEPFFRLRIRKPLGREVRVFVDERNSRRYWVAPPV